MIASNDSSDKFYSRSTENITDQIFIYPITSLPVRIHPKTLRKGVVL